MLGKVVGYADEIGGRYGENIGTSLAVVLGIE